MYKEDSQLISINENVFITNFQQVHTPIGNNQAVRFY